MVFPFKYIPTKNTIQKLLRKKVTVATSTDRIPEFIYSNLFTFPFNEIIIIALREIAN